MNVSIGFKANICIMSCMLTHIMVSVFINLQIIKMIEQCFAFDVLPRWSSPKRSRSDSDYWDELLNRGKSQSLFNQKNSSTERFVLLTISKSDHTWIRMSYQPQFQGKKSPYNHQSVIDDSLIPIKKTTPISLISLNG